MLNLRRDSSNLKPLLFFVVASVLLVACGGPAAAKSMGDPSQGKMLFNQPVIRESPGCVTCHSVEPGKVVIGPSLAGIAARAGERVAGMAAADYLHECITNPNAYVVDGFAAGIMYQKFGEVLVEEEINDLVAYLLTLE
jgi:nitric oxide reductase subunit C